MAVENIESPYIVVIHTDSYAGNFERECCAFATGIIGECGVGQWRVDDYREDETHDFLDSINSEADDNGCSRPVSIYAGADDQYNSLVIFFHNDPTETPVACGSETEFELIRRRAGQYFLEYKPMVKMIGIEVFKNEVIRKLTKIA